VLSNVSAEVAFQLPLATVTEFPSLFDDIDKSIEKLKINSYGISITTLEEVFLKVA
jgi:ATP-binding cassette subfamily A (ABC1) protein 3